MIQFGMAFISILLTSIGQLLLKKGSLSLRSEDHFSLMAQLWRVSTNLYVLGGLGVYALSTVIWLYVLSKMKLSVAYPFVSLSYVFVMIGSHYLLGESILWNQKIAMAFIIVGILFLIKS
jgi:drug/metabolite transporter (DMT)-like permease